MKKNLIIMPRFVQRVGDGYQFPLGICYISSILKEEGFDIITLNMNGHTYEDLKVIIRENAIHAVWTGGLSVHYGVIRRLIDTIKSCDPNIKIIVGGGIITGDPETTMKALEFADYGIIGEGEKTAVELCEKLDNDEKTSSVDGLIYYDENNQLKRTAPRNEINDIGTLPWPDYEGFEFEKTLNSSPGISGMNSERMIFMISSRSCPYDCTFCFHTVGRKYRQRTLDDFFEEFDFLYNKYAIEYLCLEDELFSQDMERVREFCKRIKPYNIQYWVQVRVNNVSEEILRLLKDSGCHTICFGLESADDRILKSMRKKTTIKEIERALKLVKDSGIQILGNFIFGDINETYETAMNTINWWKNNLEYKIEFSMISVYPGTYLYKYAIENNIIKDPVQFLKDGCPQINISKLSDEEFSTILKLILELPKKYSIELDDLEYSDIDYATGRANAFGTCKECGYHNEWKSVKLFMINYLGCVKCGKKYSMTLNENILNVLERNINKVIRYYSRMALWGMNLNAKELVERIGSFSTNDVSYIDISQVAQSMQIRNEKIQDPDILLNGEIDVVVVCIPHHFASISERISKQYTGVRKVINIIELIDRDYDMGEI